MLILHLLWLVHKAVCVEWLPDAQNEEEYERESRGIYRSPRLPQQSGIVFPVLPTARISLCSNPPPFITLPKFKSVTGQQCPYHVPAITPRLGGHFSWCERSEVAARFFKRVTAWEAASSIAYQLLNHRAKWQFKFSKATVRRDQREQHNLS